MARKLEDTTDDSSALGEPAILLSSLPLPDLRARVMLSTYSMPDEIGCFSYGPDRIAKTQSRESLKYFYPPPPNADLGGGFPDKFIKRSSEPERLNALLDCFAEVNRARAATNSEPIKPAFCTWRGIMTKLLVVAYSDRDEWELRATLHNRTIFIEEHEPAEKIQSKFGRTESDERFTYYGYKFESISTLSFPPSQLKGQDDPRLAARLTEPVDTNVQFCSVFKAKLGSHSLVLGGEVDCLDREPKDGELEQSLYAELKTNRVISDARQQNNFEKFKLLRIWAQSYLAGVPKVIVGFRTDEGILSHVKHFYTLEIPRIVRGKRGMWDPQLCISFAASVLDWIRANVTEDNRTTIYTIRYNPSQRRIEIMQPVRDSTDPIIPTSLD